MTEPSFTLAVNYWPRPRSGTTHLPCTWAIADHGAVRAELAQLAELGCTRVDLTLRWAEAQPGPNRLAMPALNALERALDAAHAVGLQVSVDLLGGSFAGALHLPLWAVGHRMLGDLLRARRFGPVVSPAGVEYPPILADDRYRREPAGDLYNDADLRAAAVYLVREVVGGLGGHPALTNWQLGAGIGQVRRPHSADEIRRWWQELAALALSRGARNVAGLVDAADLRRAARLRPTAIVAARAAVDVRALPIPPANAQRDWTPLDVRFLHALTAALIATETGRPVRVHVHHLGVLTAAEGGAGLIDSEAFGRPATLTLVDADQQAQFLETTIAELYHDGAAGATLMQFADQPSSAWALPPLDRSWLGRTGGIIDAAGKLKPAAAAVQAFAARLRSGALPAPAGPPALPLDPERYWYDPEGGFNRLADTFLNR